MALKATPCYLVFAWLIRLHLPQLLHTAAGALSVTDLKSVREASRVDALPGQPLVTFVHYSGFVTVEEEQHGRALFYWFFEAASSPESKPLVLWLNGGPGCSSIGYGAAQEVGPFRVNSNGTGLDLNEFSWNREANMLFLDSPVGVGFSYSNDSSDINNYGDELTAEEAYIFLTKWLDLFPEYRKRDFYMTGESYAGHYVPQLANLIFSRNNDSAKNPLISLRGFMVGNPLTDNFHDWVGIVDYAWSHAVISDELYAGVKNECNFQLANWTDKCGNLVSTIFDEYKKINVYNLYVPICLDGSDGGGDSSQRNQAGPLNLHTHEFGQLLFDGYDACANKHTIKYFNAPSVQKAMHATTTSITYNWTVCNDALLHIWKDSQFSVLPIYKKLIQGGLRIWVYSGDVDGRVPMMATRYSLSALQLPTKRSWTSWYHNHQVGGWTQDYEGITYATIRGAGHMVPQDSPSEALSLFAAFLAGTSLPNSRYSS